jgi:hypothetical protein
VSGVKLKSQPDGSGVGAAVTAAACAAPAATTPLLPLLLLLLRCSVTPCAAAMRSEAARYHPATLLPPRPALPISLLLASCNLSVLYSMVSLKL